MYFVTEILLREVRDGENFSLRGFRVLSSDEKTLLCRADSIEDFTACKVYVEYDTMTFLPGDRTSFPFNNYGELCHEWTLSCIKKDSSLMYGAIRDETSFAKFQNS